MTKDLPFVYNLTMIGLCYDIIGVIFLSLYFLNKSDNEIIAEAKVFFGYNLVKIKEMIRNKYISRIGVFLIVFGFLLQVFGVSFKDSKFWFGIFWLPLYLLIIYYQVDLFSKLVSTNVIRLGRIALDPKFDERRTIEYMNIISDSFPMADLKNKSGKRKDQ